MSTYRRLALWGTPVAVGAVLLLGLANYRATERAALESFSRRQLAWTRTVAVGVDGNLARHQASLAHLAALPSIQYVTVDFLGPRLAQFFGPPQRPGVLEIVRVTGRRDTWSWHSDGGQIRAQPEPWRDEAIWAWNVDPAHRGQQRAWIRVERGQRRLFLTLPTYQTAISDVHRTPSGIQDGFVGLVIDPTSVVGAFAQSAFDLFSGASVVVLDTGGQVLWGGGPRIEPLVGRQQAPAAFDTTADQGEIETPAGTTIVTRAPLVVSGEAWSVWMGAPRALATGEVRRTFGRQFLLFLALLTTTVAAGWTLLRIAASESRYRELFGQAADGIFVVGSDGRIAEVNTAGASLAGAAPGALAGSTFCDLVEPADRPEWQRAIERLRPGQRIVLPLALMTPSGASVATDGSLSRGPAGRTLVILRDVRERRGLEEQLQQARKMEAVGRLAGGVAHDFNNLLTAISGYNELVLASLDPGDPRRADALQVRQATERAAALTRQLLAFGRKQVLQPRVVILNELVENVERLLRRIVGEHVMIRTTLAPDLWPVEVDPGQIEQVLVNLIVNARDAMSTGGVIRVETANVEVPIDGGTISTGPAPVPGVRVSVIDAGHGMDPDTAAKIFEPFFTTKPVGTGTGLGLPTAYGIVRQSRGEIRVDTSPGQGTRFDIVLPRSTKTPAPAAVVPAEQPRDHDNAGTVLLVEDDPDVRRFTTRTLERVGYIVHAAEHGRAALALLDATSARIDVVVTDLVMPEMNGVQLVEALATSYPRLPVLLMSGYSVDVLESQGLSQLPGPMIAKPFTADELVAAIKAACAAVTTDAGTGL